MNLSNTKVILLGVIFLGLAACSNGSSGSGDKKGGTVIPELQKPALNTTKETETCTSESTDLNQDNDGETYYQFTKSSHTATRIVRYYENGVKTQDTEATTESSTCLSYQDHCNQTWEKDVIKSVSSSVVRVTNPSANLRQEATQGKMTMTLVSTDDADEKSKVGTSKTLEFSSSTLERIDGNKRYLIEQTSEGKAYKFNESAVTEVNESETSRTQNYSLLKPVKFVESDGIWTMLKSSESCTVRIEKVQN